MNVEEYWGKGWSLRPEQDILTMECLGTITKSGTRFTYYKDEKGGIWFDDEPEEGKPEWMQRQTGNEESASDILENLESYVCDGLCCHRGEKTQEEMDWHCAHCELQRYVDKIEERLNTISESGSVRCYACRYCKKVDTENGSSLYCAKDSGRLSKTTYDSTCLKGKK